MLLCGGVLRAEEPAPREETLPEIAAKLSQPVSGWDGFGAGSWVETRSTTTAGGTETAIESRTTLIGRDEKGVRFERRTILVRKDAEGLEVRELGPPTSTKDPLQKWSYEDLKDVRREVLAFGDLKVECRVLEGVIVQKAELPGARAAEYRHAATIWYAPGVKVGRGVVRLEGDVAGMIGPGLFSWETVLVDESREVRVAERTVRCAVWLNRSIGKAETFSADGEMASSEEIPGGIVSSTQRTRSKTAEGWKESVTVTEVTGFRAKPEGSD